MKTQRIITLLTSLMIMFIAVSTVSADPSLVGHWKFDEGAGTTAFDSSGNGNDGTLVNGPIWTTGILDQALELDGNDDKLIVSDAAVLDLGQNMTLCAWVQPDTTATGATQLRIIQKGGGNQGTSAYGMDLDDAVADNESRAHFYVANNYNDTAGAVSGTTNLATDGTWYFVAGTWDGSTIRIYVNGIEENSKSFSDPAVVNALDLTIGGRLGSKDHFNGRMDEVRIYNRALTASEIQELHQETGGTPGGNSGDSHSLDAADGDPIDAVFVDNEGNVGIGTTNPGTYKLAVNGTIKAKEIVVELTGWPDFVFKKDYTLMSLGQLEKYIESNKHLPQIPSEADVVGKGISIGDMQSRLLQKIEELTLYMINMKKKTEEFEQENLVLRSKNDLIKKRLEALEKGEM